MTRVALAGALLALAAVLWPRSSLRGVRRAWSGVVRRPDPDAEAVGASDLTSSWGHRCRTWFEGPPRPLRTRRSRQRDAERKTEEVLDLLDALAPALRAGLPPASALRAVASPSPERRSLLLARLLQAADRAEPLAAVWRAEADDLSSSDLALVAAAWALCERLGSPLAPTVVTVGGAVRQRRAVRQRLEAARAGPQMSMTVLSALPAVGPLLALALGVSPVDLYASPAGVASLAAGAILLGVGRLWGARLVASVGADSAAGGRHGTPRWVGAGVGPPGVTRRRRRT